MSQQVQNDALAIIQSGDYWQSMSREQPLFIMGGEEGVYDGPFLFRGDRLLAISERTAWALLRKDNVIIDKSGQEFPLTLPTYSAGVTRENIMAMSNLLQVA